jgi:hypothetical protein
MLATHLQNLCPLAKLILCFVFSFWIILVPGACSTIRSHLCRSLPSEDCAASLNCKYRPRTPKAGVLPWSAPTQPPQDSSRGLHRVLKGHVALWLRTGVGSQNRLQAESWLIPSEVRDLSRLLFPKHYFPLWYNTDYTSTPWAIGNTRENSQLLQAHGAWHMGRTRCMLAMAAGVMTEGTRSENAWWYI